MKTYNVTITALTTFQSTVDAHTPEEATSIVEQDFEDGVPMDMLEQEIESVEAIPADDSE